ncbi:MAG: hypothetical protein EXS24_07455 [Pedosphaera sp.]|nr:hypothetical protein [Pedosphaera sp.]
MTALATSSLIVGSVISVWNAPGMVAPDKFASWLRSFPRHRQIGIALMLVNMVWTMIIVYTGQYSDFDFSLFGNAIKIPEMTIRNSVFVLGPLFFLSVVVFANQYLAARGVGILLILAARPLLAAAFVEDSASRLVITVLAYVWVIGGMIFVAAPHRLRDIIACNTRTVERLRLICVVRFAFGLVLIFLALTVY